MHLIFTILILHNFQIKLFPFLRSKRIYSQSNTILSVFFLHTYSHFLTHSPTSAPFPVPHLVSTFIPFSSNLSLFCSLLLLLKITLYSLHIFGFTFNFAFSHFNSDPSSLILPVFILLAISLPARPRLLFLQHVTSES